MHQRRKVRIAATFADKRHEIPVQVAVLPVFLDDLRLTVHEKAAAAMRQDDLPLVGLDPDIPGLGSRLPPVEFRRKRNAAAGLESEARRDRRSAVGRKGQF